MSGFGQPKGGRCRASDDQKGAGVGILLDQKGPGVRQNEYSGTKGGGENDVPRPAPPRSAAAMSEMKRCLGLHRPGSQEQSGVNPPLRSLPGCTDDRRRTGVVSVGSPAGPTPRPQGAGGGGPAGTQCSNTVDLEAPARKRTLKPDPPTGITRKMRMDPCIRGVRNGEPITHDKARATRGGADRPALDARRSGPGVEILA